MNKLDFIKNLPQVQTGSFRIKSREYSGVLPNQQVLQTSKQQDNIQRRKSLQKSNSLAHTSKVVRYETNGIIYLKKVEQQQKKLRDLQNQIKEVQKQIEERRNYIGNRKRKNDFLTKPKQQNFFITTSGTETKTVNTYRKQINMNNPAEIKNEINLVNTKVAYLKKKINNWINQNKETQNQINAFRREILLYNELNQNLNVEFKKNSNQFQKIFGNSRDVSTDVLYKHLQLHKKKISKIHEQNKLIKQYDNILKTVEREMDMDKLKSNANTKPNFYMTEVNMGDSQQQNSARKFSPMSPYRKKKFNNITLIELKNILKSYEQQFEKLKLETGTDNIDEMTKKYLEEYEQNYGVYKYINNLNQQVIKEQNDQLLLKQRLAQIKTQAQIQRSKLKEQQINQRLQQLNNTIRKKKEYQKQKQDYSKIIKDLKLTLPVILNRIGCTREKFPELNSYDLEKLEESNLIPILLIIEKRKNELSPLAANDMIPKNIKFTVAEVEEQIQMAKKQYSQYQKLETKQTDKKYKQLDQKYEKFQQKQELMKNIQANQKLKKKRGKV